MAKFKGNRCIPTAEGKWDKTKEYLGLSVVLDEKTGDSYTSKKVVPAGTELTNKDYWALSGQYNAQMALIKLQLEAMQNIPEGGTTADAALENIRIGADGTEYATPGDAVRGQIGSLTEEINKLDIAAKKIDIVNGVLSTGYIDYLNVQGDPTTSTGFHTYNKMEFECKPMDKFYYTGRLLGSAKVSRASFYMDSVYVGYDIYSSSTAVDYVDKEIVIPFGVNKVIFCAFLGTKGEFEFIIKKSIYRKFIDKEELNSYEKLSAFDFVGHSNIPSLNTDYLNIICYGQSLSNGSDSLYISDDVVDSCYMLGSYIDTPSDILMPLKLSKNMQHPIVSAVNSFATLFHKFKNKDTEFIAGSYGAGGQSIAQLMSATRQNEIKSEDNYSYDISTSGRYQIFLNALTSGKQVADKNNKTLSCPAIVFLQGERDYYSDESLSTQAGSTVNAYACGGNKEKYKKYMSRLKEDMQNAVIATYKQTEKPLFLIYQVSGVFIKNHEMTINMAQIEFAEENEDVILLPSPYFVPNYSSAHLSTNGYRWYGEYIAKALFQTLVMHSKYRPVTFAGSVIDGNNIKVKVCNASLPVVIDNYTVEQTSGYGFAIWADDTRVSPYKVQVFNDEITFFTSTNLTNASKIEVSYGGMEVGGTGNIRDNSCYKAMYKYWDDSSDKGSSGSLAISHIPTDKNGNTIVGKKYPMNEWLQSFYYKIKG